ncbi:MAG: hypothetical protein LBU28_01395 [Spirochaetaceae bacterium]|nr:hypothetical protein [Spirochaetaceae bacterium]
MKYFQQHDENNCGPVSLAMVASHYNSHINIGQARKLCKTDDAMGTNMLGLVTAAEKLGFQTKALKGEVKPQSPFSGALGCLSPHMSHLFNNTLPGCFGPAFMNLRHNRDASHPFPAGTEHTDDAEDMPFQVFRFPGIAGLLMPFLDTRHPHSFFRYFDMTGYQTPGGRLFRSGEGGLSPDG